MHTGVMFLDCPAYTDRHGTAQCGLPAAVQYRYTVSSTDGPQEAAKISCPHGHWFNGPLEALTGTDTPAQPHPPQHHRPSPGSVVKCPGRGLVTVPN